ncbi:MAG TPA: IS1380 family transposase [Pirellulales bacterium]|nr:IS1380 family transposase [Pirellulales bacterium]
MINNDQLTTASAVAQERSQKRQTRRSPAPIGSHTPFDFKDQNLTPYGGLLPVATMLEKLGLEELVACYVKTKRIPRALSIYQFVLATVLCMYVGFTRFAQFRFAAMDPMLTGVLKLPRLPPQCTFWRLLASLHSSIGGRLVQLQSELRRRVWRTAKVTLRQLTLDTDTTVHTVFGRQMGGRVSYNPKKKQARSYQPILTFAAETREYIAGQLRNGDRPSAAQIRRHLNQVFANLPASVRKLRARADSGFYCWETVNAYESHHCGFIVVARKTSRLLGVLRDARWRPSRHPDADAECDFLYQPEGWPRPCRFIALRFVPSAQPDARQPEQYELFATADYQYRVFVTNLEGRVNQLVKFYNGRCAAENLIKEANNDAGIAAHPFHRFDMNDNHFQFVMLAYNLNCWLTLLQRPKQVPLKTLRHTTLATARLRFLFVAARLWRHAGRVGVSYSNQYPERKAFADLMARLRRIPAAIAAPSRLAAGVS